VAGIISSWFSVEINKDLVLIAGVTGLLLPFLMFKKYQYPLFRLLIICYILVWLVIFNHKAESPTFVIAVTGVAIWYFSRENDRINLVLLVLTFLLSVLSPTDLFPAGFRENYVKPYSLMALPCLLVWIKMLMDFFRKSILWNKAGEHLSVPVKSSYQPYDLAD
jgi:hypothetical protein